MPPISKGAEHDEPDALVGMPYPSRSLNTDIRHDHGMRALSPPRKRALANRK
jgi:hypothetical protein